MKRLLSAILPLLYLFFLFPTSRPLKVKADATFANSPYANSPSSYACILKEETYFYSEKNERSGLFTLPKTYFVKVLLSETDFTQIEYGERSANSQTLTGYCKTADLSFVDYTPSTPYLYKTFDITYSIEGATGAPFLTQITKTCVYYGDYKIGSATYAYVLQEGKFGYLPLPNGFSYSENTEYYDRLQDQPTSAPSEEKKEPTKTKSSPVQTTILILLCILIPLLAAIILKSPRRPPYDPEE